MGTFIFNKHSGIPTISATNRSKRPDQTGVVSKEKKVEKKVDIFAKGNEEKTPQTLYQDQEDWNVRVFKNKYPLIEDHEIIVHSPDAGKDIEDFTCEQTERLIKAYLNRVDYYGSQGKEVIIFNNRGGKAGASIEHPHSQLVADEGFPGILEKEKREALKYYNEYNTCIWCDDIKKALEEKDRIVYESEHFVVLVPEACRWSYEMRILPKEHKPNFGFINEEEIKDLASVLKGAHSAYTKLFDDPDRNSWIHTMRYEPFHWHIGMMCHHKVLGSLELGCDIWVSDKAEPKDAASELRELVEASCEVEPKGEVISTLL